MSDKDPRKIIKDAADMAKTKEGRKALVNAAADLLFGAVFDTEPEGPEPETITVEAQEVKEEP